MSNYYVSKAVVAFRGRPRFLFCPKAMSLADGGDLQDFNLNSHSNDIFANKFFEEVWTITSATFPFRSIIR
ncbi:unnamed protein product [Rotaria sp. Silwood2]|nr:unnamed protein product [Rotaria sp. Silwood2]